MLLLNIIIYLISNFKDTNTFIKEIDKEEIYGNMVSCYLSSGGLIYCFYMYKANSKIYFRLDKYEKDLTGNKDLSFESNLWDEMSFYKCINFKDEVSVLAFYGDFNSIFYPIFLFRNFNISIQNFEDYIPGNSYYSGIYLSKKEFSNQLGVNDVIKISENKLAFSCIAKDKETIYIIIINMFSDKKLKARYYSINAFKFYTINAFKFYNLKVLLELRIHKYNSFIAFAASFCSQKKCEDNDDKHFSSLIIFSYPNGTDYAIDLEKYLYDNNDIKIKRIEINLKNKLNIDNNIFGHIFSSIVIQKVQLSKNYKLYSSKDETKEMESNSNLGDNENIILKPQMSTNKLPSLNLYIEYYFKIKEPEFEMFDTYPEEKEGENDQQFFSQDEYKGKLNYYKIQSNNELTLDCNNVNCELCFYDQRDICITCKYNFITTEINQKLSKICKDEEKTDIVTEKFTDQLSSSILDEISIDKTNEKAKATTYVPSDEFTEKITNIDTENLIKETDKINQNTINIKVTEQISDEIKNENKTKSCINEEILKNKYCNGTITNQQIGEIHDDIKNKYINEEHKGNNTIIKTDNVIFQVSTHEDQKNSDNADISSIDLGICEETLKIKNNIPMEESLIILKTDIKSEDLSQTYVYYEVSSEFR